MELANVPPPPLRLRLLVVIASFGDKNLSHLKCIIETYQRMPFVVHVVVVSNAPKSLGAGVEVIVGLPSSNPWSLPFAHKRVFADNSDNYDLFIYSEDDMEVTEANIAAFVRITPDLAADEIAGYLRYEQDSSGNQSLPEIHGAFHWKPESIVSRGSHVVAEFSNEHAAFYLINRAQLKRCIASGGFLRPPCEGRYDMLCTAATDPYTNCGFRKVICISEPSAFLIHHRPNRYAGQLGISMADFYAQTEILKRLGTDKIVPAFLGVRPSKLKSARWSKGFYEPVVRELLDMVPARARTVLSVGCGWGAGEAELQQRGLKVTGLPLDSFIGTVAEKRGVEVIHGSLAEGLQRLNGQQFDVVIISNLLHLFEKPNEIIAQCVRHINRNGSLLVMGPNFERLQIRIRRVMRRGEFAKLRSYGLSGLSAFSASRLKAWAAKAGLRLQKFQWLDSVHQGAISGAYNERDLKRRKMVQSLLRRASPRLYAESWLVLCQWKPSDETKPAHASYSADSSS